MVKLRIEIFGWRWTECGMGKGKGKVGGFYGGMVWRMGIKGSGCGDWFRS